jgi:hypothetical protein
MALIVFRLLSRSALRRALGPVAGVGMPKKRLSVASGARPAFSDDLSSMSLPLL